MAEESARPIGQVDLDEPNDHETEKHGLSFRVSVQASTTLLTLFTLSRNQTLGDLV